MFPTLPHSYSLSLRHEQEFGIDIVSDDGKTIVHHKVAAQVFVVMNADDAMSSSRSVLARQLLGSISPEQPEC